MFTFISDKSEYATYTEGDFRLKKFSGKIKLFDANGTIVYIGEYEKGKLEGNGTLYKDGDKYYSGDFVDNEMLDDKGTIYYQSGEIQYQGQVVNGNMQGEGKLFYKEGGQKINGNFINNAVNGHGVLYDKDGNIIYEGDFKDDYYHGVGTLFNPNGSIAYEGAFVDGKMQGNGTLYTKLGKKLFTGEMVNNHIHYDALFNLSLTALFEHFKVTPLIYQYEKHTAFVYEDINVMFISENPIYFTKKNIHTNAATLSDKAIDEFSEYLIEVDDSLDKDDVIINEIILVEQVWHDPSYAYLNKDKLDEYLKEFNASKTVEEEMDYHQGFVHMYLNRDKKMYDDVSINKISDFIYVLASYTKKKYSSEIFATNDYLIHYVFEKNRLLYSLINQKGGLVK